MVVFIFSIFVSGTRHAIHTWDFLVFDKLFPILFESFAFRASFRGLADIFVELALM